MGTGLTRKGWSELPETLSPSERSLRARLAAHTLHSTRDPREHTAPARKAFLDRFLVEVDPEGVLTPEERRRRAQSALKAHMTRLALQSARARKRGVG